MVLISLWGQIFATRESGTSKLHSVAYIELYQYPWLPVHQVTSSTVVAISIISLSICRCHKVSMLSYL